MKKAFLKRTIGAVVAAATITMISPLAVSAQGKQSTANNVNSTSYNKTINAWKKIGNKWYYFNANGKVQTGWIKSKNKWYYADKTGVMQTGLVKINGKTYYLAPAGDMQTGFIKMNGKLYYFNKSGELQKVDVVKPTAPATNTGTNKNTNTDTTKPVNTNNTSTQVDANVPPAPVAPVDTNTTMPSTSVETKVPVLVIPEDTNTQSTPVDTQVLAPTVPINNSTSTNITTVDVNGLPKLPQTYSITVQSSAETKILELMNQKRVEAGLKPLVLDNTLLQVARYKSNHMIQYNYFDHTNPDGTKWTSWLRALNYNYTTAGENIAYNSYDPVELFNQWWNSPGHKANMMNPSYTKVGIGVIEGNRKYMGTQEFSN